MRVGYVTTYNSTDIKAWSGLGYFIANALKEQSIEVIPIGGLNDYTDLIIRTKQRFYGRIAKKTYQDSRDPKVLKHYADQIAQKLENLDVDVVLSPGTLPIAYLNCKQPIVFWTDATYAGMIDFYPGWSNLCLESKHNGNRAEQAALSNCHLALYSSDWAANTATKNYVVNPSAIKVVPFGANIVCDRTLTDIRAIVNNRVNNLCKLLFLGVDWDRKGADVAVQTAEELNKRGLKTELTIAGCKPPDHYILPDFVSIKGFISKATPEGQATIDRLFSESHFLILPSRAECLAVVIAEAFSFGVPAVTSNVGGMTTAVSNGINGAAFSLQTFVEQASYFILTSMESTTAYQQLAEGAFREYETRLNWRIAGKTVKSLLEDVLA
jgi:glycosyltransferase involved in cell wall biosynthesis